ncbi:MAG: phospholipid carrier-dependent glycosyltransferase [Deltaproteobacteria bacterium]|nr:phospholipid carrier-dependent glycosyltransferase [Deltaproteobacteria bacterium]
MNRARTAVLLLLTLVGGVLRFPSTDFGLPDKYRPDEEYMLSRALGFERNWNPNFTVYPAAHMYVQHGVLRAYALVHGYKRGFREVYAKDRQALAYLVARRTSAAFGTATIPATYLAAARAFGPPAALAAATIVTFSTIHVRESKYATTDAATTFWITIALWLVLRVIRLGRVRDSLLAGLVAGFAVANKYPAGAALVAVGLAHFEARWREGRSLWRTVRDLRPYVAVYAAVVAFLCATPYFVLDWDQTVRDFAYQRGFVQNGVGNIAAGWGWSWLAFKVLPHGFGTALALLLVAGLVWALVRPGTGTLPILAFVLVAFAGMAGSRYSFYRYVMVPLPGLVLLAGRLVGDVAAGLASRMPARRAQTLVAAALAALLVPSAIRDWKLNRILARHDTRTLAREWIERNQPGGGTIAASDHGTPYGKPQLPPGYTLAPIEDVATLRAKGIRLVVADTSPLAFYSPGPTPEQLADLDRNAALELDLNPIGPEAPAPVFDLADAFYAPLQHASSMSRPGPRIRIWRIDP